MMAHFKPAGRQAAPIRCSYACSYVACKRELIAPVWYRDLELRERRLSHANRCAGLLFHYPRVRIPPLTPKKKYLQCLNWPRFDPFQVGMVIKYAAASTPMETDSQ